jgi:hypothetical protein
VVRGAFLGYKIRNVLEAASNKTLGIEDSVAGVHGGLIFGSVTNQTLLVGKGNIGRCCPISL